MRRSAGVRTHPDGFAAPTVFLVVTDGKAPPGNEKTPFFPSKNPSRRCPAGRIPPNFARHSRTHSRADKPPVAPKLCGTQSCGGRSLRLIHGHIGFEDLGDLHLYLFQVGAGVVIQIGFLIHGLKPGGK